MIKVIYKSMTIEFECLADVITFVEHFNPPDKIFGEDELKNLENHFKEQIEKELNKDVREYNIKESSKIPCKNKEELMARNYLGIKDVYRLSSDKVEIVENDLKESTRIIKYVDFERMIDHALKELNLKVPHIPFENIEVTKPGIPKRIDLQSFDKISLPPKKKRGRPKKVTEHDDKVLAIAGLEKGVPLTEENFEDIEGKEFVEGVCEKFAESIVKESNKNKEDLIMGIDDIAKELSKTKAMLFSEEALRKIFQKAYKPALKTDVKATYPLTKLDPQMCNTFVSEVSNKLGMKCTLSYKVGKSGFTYILMK